MLLSVIVPIYNLKDYIGECLESLMDQNVDENKYEVIVVNDGSTDNSGKILDEFASKYKNIVVYHKSNGGVSSARNFALDCAKGDYIWFVDGDDLIAPNVLKEIFLNIKVNAFPDLVKVNVQAFIDGKERPDFSSFALLGEGTVEYSDWMFTWFIKRNIIENNNIRFDENVALGEDDIFCVFVNQYVRTIVKVNKIVYFYRQREGSALHSAITDKNFVKFLKSYSASLDYAKKYDFFWYKKDMVYECMPNIMLFVAEKPYRQAKQYIKRLKEYRLFPLPRYIKDEDKGNKDSNRISGAKKIRQNSYTLKGYYILRAYLMCQKIKKKLKS